MELEHLSMCGIDSLFDQFAFDTIADIVEEPRIVQQMRCEWMNALTPDTETGL